MFDIKVPFLDLTIAITKGKVLSKVYYKGDYFNFEMVTSTCLDGDIPGIPSNGVFNIAHWL